MKTKKNHGFSLIELLIVVAIILIIAAIAIPNLLRARISANETSAVASLRTLNTTAVQYAATYPAGNPCGFPAGLANLGPGNPATPAAADLIDAVLATGAKNGYNFRLVGASADANGCLQTFGADATPVNVGTTGQRAFCIDNTGVVRFNTTGAAIGTGVGVCGAVPNVLQ
jgi:prepilin-type N-terminal cleavage/methylation domain-containing protein